MDNTTKIAVTNTTRNPITIILPDSKFSRTWAPQSTFKVPYEILQEELFDHGFMVCIDQGNIFIEDKEARVELGLEEEDAEPIVKILTGAQLTRLLKAAPLGEFEDVVKTLTKEQCETLIDMGIEQKNIDMNKADILKTITGIDAVKAIELKKKYEEIVDD